MSQSGVPIVSDIAKVAVNTANSVSNIASGGNVFENLGRIAIQPATFAAGTLHSTSFGALDKAPIIGNAVRSGNELANNPTSRRSAIEFAQTSAKVGAIAGGAIVGGPLIAGQLGVGAGAGAALGGGLASKLSSGDFEGAANLAGGAVTGYLGGTDIGQAISPYTDDIKNLINSAPKNSANSPINNITPANQVLNKNIGFSGATVAAVLLISGAGYLLMKKYKVI